MNLQINSGRRNMKMEKLMSIIERAFEFLMAYLREMLDLVKVDEEGADA